MAKNNELKRLLVHESIESVVPKEAFVNAFNEFPITTELVGDDEAYNGTDAVATYVPRKAFLDAGWVHCTRAGYDKFDTAAYKSAGVPLTNSTGIHGSTVGEVAIGSMLSLARLIHLYRDHQNEQEWYTPPYARPFTLEGERLCVIGLGTIGQSIAHRANALGMEVVGVRRSGQSVTGVSVVHTPDELHDAIRDARFVALSLPHTPETDGLIGAAEFDTMREDAYLINVARGPLVDEDALVNALTSETISGAALDVFDTEPLPEGSPLWGFDDVIIMPHKGSATNCYHLDLAALTKENLRRFRVGESLKNRVA